MKATALLSRLAVGTTIGLATLGSALPAQAKPTIPAPALVAPAGLTAKGGPEGITVSWKASGDAGVEVTATALDDQGRASSCQAAIQEGSCLIAASTPGNYAVSALAADLNAQLRSAAVDLGEVAVPVVDPPVVLPPSVELPSIGGWAVTAANDSAVAVSWKAVDRPDLYLVVWAEDADGNRPGFCWAAPADGSCVLADLSNGTTYAISYAVFDGQNFSGATEVAQATPVAALGAEPPGAPTDVYAYQLNAPATAGALAYVTWTASASDGGAPVNRYEVTATDPSGAVVASCTSSRWAEGCQLEGLAFGGSYVVTVVAVNSAGTSDPGRAKLSDLLTPPQPISIDSWSLQASDSAVTLGWNAPAGSGDLTVVAWAEDAAGSSYASCWANVADGRCELADLENGTAYRVTVLVFDGWNGYDPVEVGTATPEAAVGAEPPSAPSEVTVYQQQPGFFGSYGYGNYRGYQTYVGAGQPVVYVNWKASASNGGAPIKRYEVTATSATGEIAASCSSSRWAEGCQLEGLTVGESYGVSVVAINSAGTSEPGLAKPFTLEAAPPPPSFGSPEVVALAEGGYLVRWSVKDASAFPGLAFTVGSDQGASCSTTYELGSGEASCVLSTEDGAAPTGVYVSLDELRYLLGGPDPWPESRGGPPGAVDDQVQQAVQPSPRAEVTSDRGTALAEGAPQPAPAGSQPVAPRDIVATTPAPRELATDLAVQQARSRSALPEGSAAVAVLLVLLAMAVPLLRRRR